MKPSSGSAETRLLFALWLVIFAVSTQIMVVAPILNGIGEELSIRTARLADLLTVYPAVVGVFALVAGPISDRVGRRRVLIWGSGIMTGALLLHGVAWDYWSLMLFRAMAGVGGGVLSGAAVALVGDFFPSKKRGWANGWMMTGLAVGQIVGIPAARSYRSPPTCIATARTPAPAISSRCNPSDVGRHRSADTWPASCNLQNRLQPLRPRDSPIPEREITQSRD